MNISILYEDDQLWVIDKPAGITVNKSETTIHQETIQDWAEEQFKIKNLTLTIDQGDFFGRAGIVHRLDKETSGILLIAKTVSSFENLQMQFKERTVKKTYLALAHGEISPTEGEVNVPVGRLPWNRKQFGIIPGGRESKTLYKSLHNYQDKKTKEKLTLVELYPQSGRTHQIRVHLKYINHPVFSDFLYAGRKTARNDRKVLPRVFLHAAKISFLNPSTGEMLSIECQMPDELTEAINKLSA